MPWRQRRSSACRTAIPRREGEGDVEDQEDCPRELRHLVGALVLQRVGHVVGLKVQRADDAEDHGEDAADEDAEEIVDARPAPPQPVETLDVIRQRHQHGDERQDVDVLRERRQPLGDGDETALEPDGVGQQERRHAEDGVGDDVVGDEAAGRPLHHRTRSSGAVMRASTSVVNASMKRWREKRSACARTTAGSNVIVSRRRIAAAKDSGVASSTRMPVRPSTTVSRLPPRPRAMTGRPAGLRFDWHDAEILLARQENGAGLAGTSRLNASSG